MSTFNIGMLWAFMFCTVYVIDPSFQLFNYVKPQRLSQYQLLQYPKRCVSDDYFPYNLDSFSSYW